MDKTRGGWRRSWLNVSPRSSSKTREGKKWKGERTCRTCILEDGWKDDERCANASSKRTRGWLYPCFTSLTRLLSPQTHRRWNIDLLLFHPRGMLRAFVFTSREISNDSSGRRFLYRLVEISFGGFFFFYLYPKFMDNINSTTRSRFRERDGLPLIRRINSGERRISRFSFSWFERFVWDDFEIHCNSWPIFPSRYDYIIFPCG